MAGDIGSPVLLKTKQFVSEEKKMKKTIVLSLIAVLCLGLTSAAATVNLGNFEGTMDNWEMQSGATGTYSTFGATNGASSLEVVFPSGWKTVMKLNMLSQLDVMKTMEEFSLDLTTRNDNGQIPAWWLNVILVVNSETGSWQDMGDKYTAGVPWSPRTETLSWTIPQSIRDNFIQKGAGGWAELFIVTNSGASGTLWVDNINAKVPEPATLSVLGLGALALLKRRKA